MSIKDFRNSDFVILDSKDMQAIQLENVKAVENKNHEMKNVIIILGVVLATGLAVHIYNESKRRKEIYFPYKF